MTALTENLEVIILAAGLGTRMKSATIKILHRAGGRPIIDYVLDLARELCARPPIMVIGHQREAVQKAVGERARYAVQDEQKGTGHAVLQAAALVEGSRHILILSGDVPLTRPATLRRLLDEHERSQNALTLLTMKLDDFGLYGRVVRDAAGAVTRIVEARDASEDEKRIEEVNAGIYVFDGRRLFDNLRNLSTHNAQGEYYLTDLLGVLRNAGMGVGAVIADDPIEALGVNSRADLASVEGEIQRRVIAKLMTEGVTFRNPATVVIDSTVAIGNDTVVYPFVTIEGKTTIGSRCVIEPGVHLTDVTAGNDVRLKTGTVAENADIGDEASVGPYAHLRPGTRLGRHVKIGNLSRQRRRLW
jgi:bifunctional UDP-N-acetylglucosamine pyrophosphorylase/glucosamine-1-phosphate N-acetyltransferase